MTQDDQKALGAMVVEKCDYMKINNLGDPEETHTVKQARAALGCPICGSQMVNGRCVMVAVEGSQCRANARAALAQSDDPADDSDDWKCVNGHDLCYGGASAGPECPYCEKVSPSGATQRKTGGNAMTTNPTPGPWTQGSNYEVVASDGTNICKVHNDEGQGAANARLIAKVPAMLEALRALSEQFERFAPFDSQAEIRAADEARAILARIGDGGAV